MLEQMKAKARAEGETHETLLDLESPADLESWLETQN